MRRRDFISIFGSAAAWPLAARAKQAERVQRITALMSMTVDDPEAQPRVAAFESGLRELGWLDGRNLQIEYRWVSDGDLLRRIAAELARMPPDLILATSTPVMAALQEQGLSVPIMFVQVTDPVGQGLVPNLARPGGHITGFTNFEFSIGTKWLEALKQIAPRVTSGRAHLQPGDRAVRRPVPTAGGGRGSCLRRDADHGRRALRCRD